jgi:SLOG family YspA-like protein
VRVLVCGSRDWDDRTVIARRLVKLPSGTLVILGGAKGADAIAEEMARARGLHTAVVRALWTYGSKAGPIRNRVMLDLEPDLVLAFSNGTKGTQDTIDEARRRGIAVEVIGREAARRADRPAPAQARTGG